jgi:hypothetical protein
MARTPRTPAPAAQANVIPLPTGRQRARHLRLIVSNRLLAQARQGMQWLSPHEKVLIELWRMTSPTGRNAVMRTASAVQRAQPWDDRLHGG